MSHALDFWYFARKDMFATFQPKPGCVVMLGDSLTQSYEWEEVLGERFLNRGIGSDDTINLLNRLYQVTDLQPSRVFVLIGINDILRGESTEAISARYKAILSRLLAKVPEVITESVLPTSEPSRRRAVVELNSSRKRIAAEEHSPFLDLYPLFADSSGMMMKRYTTDGVHLTAEGYRVWSNAIRSWTSPNVPALPVR